MIPSRRVAAVAAIALSSLVAACGPSGGNGEDGKSADQIVKDAQAALKSATSFHMSGTVNDSDTGAVTIDMKVQDKNTTSGHLSSGGVGFDYVVAAGRYYIRGSQLWAKYNPDVAPQIGDKWVSVAADNPAAGQLSSVLQLADASALAGQLGSSGGPYTKSGTGTEDGQPVVVVKGKNGQLDVALDGTPYPVLLNAGSNGSLVMDQYGNRFDISAPSGALDLSSLGAQSSSTSSSSSDSGTTKEVVDATQVRDGVIQIAEGTITSSSGSVFDAWGVGQAVSSQLPSSIDVSLQTGDAGNVPPATPTRVVLYAAQTGSGDLFLVVVQDVNGNCQVGALSGNPPNGNPQTQSIPAGTDCTVASALNALNS